MKKKALSIIFTVVLSLSCIVTIYGNEGDEVGITTADDISTCSSYVIDSMSAIVASSQNYYYGDATMLSKGTGKLKIFLWKMSSDGSTHTTVDQAETSFTNKSTVTLQDYYNLTFNSGTYKCRAYCYASDGSVTETMSVISQAVKR